MENTKTEVRKIKWQDLEPTSTLPEQQNDLEISCRIALTQMLNYPLETMVVRETFGNIAICEWVPEPLQQRSAWESQQVAYDPYLPVPLIAIGDVFNKAFRSLADYQERYVTAGGNPHPDWQYYVNSFGSTLIEEMDGCVHYTTDEKNWFRQKLQHIIAAPRDWLPVESQKNYGVLYVSVFFAVFVILMILGFLFI